MPDTPIPLAYSQNFLRDPRLIDDLLEHSSIACHDLVYEIGPGTGIITDRLLLRCRRVVAIERDGALAARLRLRLRDCPHVTIHSADFLRFPLPVHPYKVFANIPFNRTSAIIARLTAEGCAPLDSYLVVQREAAWRFLGSPRATLPSVLLHPWFDATVCHQFKRGDFRPAPQVESVLLRLRKRGPPLVSGEDGQIYRDFVSFAFTAPEPSIYATLSTLLGHRGAMHLARTAGLALTATPSMVPGTLWLLLFEHLKDAGGRRAYRMVAGAEQRVRHLQAGLHKLHRTRTPISAAKQGHRQLR